MRVRARNRLHAPAAILKPVRESLDLVSFRLRLQRLAGGDGQLSLDLGRSPDAATRLLAATCRRFPHGAAPLRRVIRGLERSGALQRALDGLAGPDRDAQLRGIRLAGALRLEDAVPWLEPFLGSSSPRLRSAAAMALGRIGGARAADSLVKGLRWRRGSMARLAIELARAAPDHCLETKLAEAEPGRVQASLVLAAGLRRRRSAVPSLLAVLESGTRNTRALAARALGSIGAPEAVPALGYAAVDPEWPVRAAAAKALGSIPGVPEGALSLSLVDRDPRVRRTAEVALRRLLIAAAPAEPGAPPWP